MSSIISQIIAEEATNHDFDLDTTVEAIFKETEQRSPNLFHTMIAELDSHNWIGLFDSLQAISINYQIDFQENREIKDLQLEHEIYKRLAALSYLMYLIDNKYIRNGEED